MKILTIGLALAMPVAASAAKLITTGTTELFSSVEKASDEAYTLDAEDVAATSNLVVTVVSAVDPFATLADSSKLDELAGSGYIGAIAATTNRSSGAVAWMATANGAWVELSGPAPATNIAYTVKTELDLGAKKLRHSVKASGASDFTALGDWLPANVGNPALTNILAVGDFDIATLSGTCSNSTDIAVTGAGSIAFDPDALAGVGITGDAAAVESALNAKGANGIAKWQNYVLGISTTDPNAKPYAAPVQNADPSNLTFSLGGVDVNASSGATVKYAVGEVDSPSSDFAPSSWVNPDEAIQLEVPSGVKYYRMKVKIDTP